MNKGKILINKRAYIDNFYDIGKICEKVEVLDIETIRDEVVILCQSELFDNISDDGVIPNYMLVRNLIKGNMYQRDFEKDRIEYTIVRVL